MTDCPERDPRTTGSEEQGDRARKYIISSHFYRLENKGMVRAEVIVCCPSCLIISAESVTSGEVLAGAKIPDVRRELEPVSNGTATTRTVLHSNGQRRCLRSQSH